MKISILMAYHKRPIHIKNTLESYKIHYDPQNIEVVLIEDTPNDKGTEVLSVLEQSGIPFVYRSVDRSDRQYKNPGVLYNLAAEVASNDVLHLTNPENLHVGPILNHCQDYIKNDNYIVYGCRTLSTCLDSARSTIDGIDQLTNWGEASGWYQHSKIYNRLLHFASVIHKDLYFKIEGFDPAYDYGVGYEDNDFIQKLFVSGTSILAFDDPYAAHQAHDRAHWMINDMKGIEINSGVYLQKWGRSPMENYPGF